VKYMIISAHEISGLTTGVNDCLRLGLGYRPCGGVSAYWRPHPTRSVALYSQVMVKETFWERLGFSQEYQDE